MSKQSPNVAVLLATHNPPKFIEQQIESIKNQIGVNVQIYWGDYDSSVETKNYIRKLLKSVQFQEFDIKNPGPAENFFELLKKATEEFIAFADQDDIWLPNKLSNQVNQLKKTPLVPSLVHSTVQILKDEQLTPRKPICSEHKFFSLALSNCCQGCTLMINSVAQRKILNSLPEKIIWHDWWIGLVVSSTGVVHYSKQVEVIYRIHNSNTIGIPSTFNKIFLAIRRPSGQISWQINQILKSFQKIEGASSQDIALIRCLISESFIMRLKGNLELIIREGIFSQNLLRRILWTIKRP
jgi:rhamnosyltransferase